MESQSKSMLSVLKFPQEYGEMELIKVRSFIFALNLATKFIDLYYYILVSFCCVTDD